MSANKNHTVYRKRTAAVLLVISILLSALLGTGCERQSSIYSDVSNWAYYGNGEERAADLFLVCPLVDLGESGDMNMSLDNDDLKASFLGALNMERGIYEDVLTLYAPYYRQATFPVYSLPEGEAEPYLRGY